jgi:ApeA N-terminal domain 1
MPESYSARGTWWLAGADDNHHHGLLTFTPEGGGVLELIGCLSQDFPETPLFVLGTTSDGKPITLPRAICTKLGRSESVYSSTVVLVGIHFSTDQDLVFDEIAVEYDHFSAWFAPPQTDFAAADGGLTVTFRHPTEVMIFDGAALRISIRHGYSESIAWDRECPFQLRLHNTVSIESRGDLATLMSLAVHFKNLVTLGLGQPIGEKWIRVRPVVPGSNCDVQVLYEPISTAPKDRKYTHDRLFSYQDLGDTASEYLGNWFDRRAELDSVLALYFNTLFAPAPFVDVRLLNLIQALESYHRRVVGTTDLPKDEHRLRVETALVAVPQDLREWVKSKLEHSNEVPLLARINWVLSEFAEVLKPIVIDPERIAKQLRDNRNYMTHFDVRLKKKRALGSELAALVELCKLLLELICMREMGLPPELIAQIAPRSRSYRTFAYLTR